jgi:hypothetical protein
VQTVGDATCYYLLQQSNVLDAGPIQSRGGCSFIWALPVIVFQLQVNCLCCFTASAARAFRLKAVCLVPVQDGLLLAEEHSRDKLASIFYVVDRRLVHFDLKIGSVCTGELRIAFSYEGMDALMLDSRLWIGPATVLLFCISEQPQMKSAETETPQRYLVLRNLPNRQVTA